MKPEDAKALIGRTVTVYARRSNSNAYKSEPEKFVGRVVAIGKILGTYNSAPYAIVLDAIESGAGVPIISIPRIVRIECA